MSFKTKTLKRTNKVSNQKQIKN